MEIVRLRVDVDKSQLTTLESQVSSLSGRSIKINVEVTGLDNLPKVTNAQARVIDGEKKLQIQREKTKQATIQRTISENNLAIQMEKTATAETNARTANTNLSKEIQKATTEQEKQATAAAQTALQQEKTATSAQNLALQTEKTATANATATQSIKETGEAAKRTGDTVGSMVQKFASWYLIAGAVTGVIDKFKQALTTMKAVDDELVVVRKVSGATASELKVLEEQAYKTGSAYGAYAHEYLSSVAEFTRAGYKDKAAELGELSVKTQLVGDTTEQTANQFLLSVDAAYKMEGSVSKLTAVLDGANEIDNKYATSIEKIAEGLGKVAPIASQAHVGINELSAALGTITATTQRSGTEAATAVRALFLNIMGDTKTEIDEGVTWTTGEITGLRDIIKMYSADAYEAAKATGSLINPMEAIGGLAQSMKDGILTEEQLMSMISDIGGKLRSTQLMTLVQNWDMYESMLADYAAAAGSADREVENAMNSWSRKVAVLDNTWTQFIAHMVDTEGIKGGIDVVTAFVDALDSGFGRLIISTIALTAALAVLAKIPGALMSSNILWGIGRLVSVVKLATVGVTGLKAATLGFTAVWNASPFVIIGGAIALISGVVAIVDALTVTFDEQKEIVADLNTELSSLNSEYDSLKANVDNLTESDRARLVVLEAQIKANETLLKQEQRKLLNKWSAVPDNSKWGFAKMALGSTADKALEVYSTAGFEAATKKIEEIQSTIQQMAQTDLPTTDPEKYKDYQARLETRLADAEATRANIVTGLSNRLDMLNNASELGVELTQSEINERAELTALLSDYAAAEEYAAGATADSNKETENATKSLAERMETLDDLSKRLKTAQSASEEFADGGKLTYSTISDIAEQFGEVDGIEDYIDRLTDADLSAEDFRQIMQELTEALVSQELASGDLSAEDETLIAKMLEEAGVSDALAVAHRLVAQAQNSVAFGSGVAAQALTKEEAAAKATAIELMRAKLAANNLSGTDIDVSKIVGKLDKVAAHARNAAGELARVNGTGTGVVGKINAGAASGQTSFGQTVIDDSWKYDIPPGGGGSSGGGSSSDDTDETLEALKTAVSLREQELKFIQASGGSTETQIAKMHEVQAALKNQADYMRSIGADAKGVLEISTDWWNIQNDITELLKDDAEALEKEAEAIKKMQEELWSELETAMEKALSEAAEARDKEIDAIDLEIEKIKEAAETEEESLKLEELKADVLKKQNELLDAQKDRKVRVYNAATGQWEWQGDAKTILSAQEALNNAKKDLKDYQSEFARDAAIRAMEERKDALNAAYDTLEENWKTIVESIQDPARDIEDILRDIAEKGTPLMQAQVDNVNTALGKLNNYINAAVGAGTGGSYFDGGGVGDSGSTRRNYSTDTTDYSALMERSGSAEEFNYWATQRNSKMEAQGIDASASGYRTNEQIYSEWKSKNTFDFGGILNGMGGIKATTRPETILDPELTEAAILKPVNGTQFRERAAQLGYLFGARDDLPGAITPGNNVTNSNSYGDSYYYGNITLSEAQAKGMTVYDLARLSGSLAVYSNT